MLAESKRKRDGNASIVNRYSPRLGAPRALRTGAQKSVGTMRPRNCMPNGDPPSVMLWGAEE